MRQEVNSILVRDNPSDPGVGLAYDNYVRVLARCILRRQAHCHEGGSLRAGYEGRLRRVRTRQERKELAAI